MRPICKISTDVLPFHLLRHDLVSALASAPHVESPAWTKNNLFYKTESHDV